MSNRAKCIGHCMDFLKSMQLENIFNEKDFNYVYRKAGGAYLNPYTLGLDIADYIIFNFRKSNNESRIIK